MKGIQEGRNKDLVVTNCPSFACNRLQPPREACSSDKRPLARSNITLARNITGDSVLYNSHHAEAGFALLSNGGMAFQY